ncbi:MAG: BON domain-containing protein, partial [Caldilineaceae bacterium]|nr:BON domain-containing protein [Caldilineaceae bacterium]MBP9072304.1 BON domain-containing protein [Caldilineaceae bacterium]
VTLAESAELDLAELLRQLGEADLADLPVTANRSGGEIQLTGTVPTAAQRTRMIDTLAAVPGVTAVDALNLVVRVDKSYTTQAGDNLWRIAEALYGDGRRWQEIYDLNKALLGNNPGAIFTNMELQLPPMQ